MYEGNSKGGTRSVRGESEEQGSYDITDNASVIACDVRLETV